MIPLTGQYALRAAAFLARHEGSAQKAAVIALETHIPEHFTAKILQELSRCKVVSSQRGIGGGYQLALPAARLTVLDVLLAVNCAPAQICRCQGGATAADLCPAQGMLDRIAEIAREIMATTTLASLIDGPAEKPDPLWAC